MAKTAFVRPAPALKVRMPGRLSEFLPVSGASVPLDSGMEGAYWHARIRNGDVIVVEEPPPAAPKRPAAPGKKD